ncbi:hypothetical protein [Acinetobacter variabilis]|uniref:hypothetical protein n=1 Tax=Acinetobacter variabilis TaxID=70346 RepID=UPI003A8AC3D8
MSAQNTHYQRILSSISQTIEQKFDKIGLLYRLFGRVKSDASLKSKITSNPGKYSTTLGGKKIQDVIGLRITLYFTDDLDIAISILKKLFDWDEQASNIDDFSHNTFEATRCNLIFKLPKELCLSLSLDAEGYCDNTFEVQIRTVFSEGWHEVEHDLRYKHKSDWDTYNDATRTLNGFLASLETVDWGILQLLEDLSYKHYKAKNWEAMLRNKLRIRISNPNDPLKENILSLFNDHKSELGKSFYRLNRPKIINQIYANNISLPLTLNNLVYIINELEIKNKDLSDLTPSIIMSKIHNNQ